MGGTTRQSEATGRLGLSVRQVSVWRAATGRAAPVWRRRGAAGGRTNANRPSGSPGGAGSRARAVSGLRSDVRMREARGRARPRLSAETLHGWMIADGLRRPKRARRCASIRADRGASAWATWGRSTTRRTTGSRAAGPRCTLIVYADGATSRLLAVGFHPAETTEAYMNTTRALRGLRATGGALPGSPRRVPDQRSGPEGEPKQFARAADLGRRVVPRGKPAGQGPHGTGKPKLQDRLMKEMRLRGICGRGGQGLPAGIRGGLQPAHRRGAAHPRRRTARCCTTSGSWTDPLRAARTQDDLEPIDQLRRAHLPGHGTQQGLPPAPRRKHRVPLSDRALAVLDEARQE